jgi:Tfp pilus assembly protein PilO
MKISRTIWLLAVVGILIIAGCILGLAYKNQAQEQASLKQQVTLNNNRIKSIQLQNLIDQEASLNSQIKSNNNQISTIQKNLTQPVEYGAIVTSVYAIAKDVNVDISNITSSGIVDQNQEQVGFQSLPLNIEINGDTLNIIRFVQKITAQFPTSTIKSMEMTASQTIEPEFYAWSLDDDSAKAPWLKLDPRTGIVSGTPIVCGNYYFTVRVTDGGGRSSTRILSIRVNPATDLTVNEIELPHATVSFAYEYELKVTGGPDVSAATTPYTWKLDKNSMLPDWAELGEYGKITGTPDDSDIGTSTFSVNVTDALSTTTTQVLSLTVDPFSALDIENGALPDAILGYPYQQTLKVAGGSFVAPVVKKSPAVRVFVDILSYKGN